MIRDKICQLRSWIVLNMVLDLIWIETLFA